MHVHGQVAKAKETFFSRDYLGALSTDYLRVLALEGQASREVTNAFHREWYSQEITGKSAPGADTHLMRPGNCLRNWSRTRLQVRAKLDDSLIHVGFFDSGDRQQWAMRPIAGSLERIAALSTNLTSGHVRFHAIFLRRPSRSAVRLSKAFRVHTLLPLPPHAECVHTALQRLSWKAGPAYLYKPLLHWLLPPSIHHLILLDLDTVVLRDLRPLWLHFNHFDHAVVGIASEQ